MNKLFTKLLLLFFVLAVSIVGTNTKVSAQCSNGSSYGSLATAPAYGLSANFSTCSYAGEYSPCNGGFVLGATYVASTSAAYYITVRSGSAAGPVVAYGLTPLTFVAPTTGAMYFHWNTAGCGSLSGCVITTLSYPTVVIPPVVTSFTPSSGCAGSASVVITGTNLTSATAVTFGGTAAQSYVVNSSTQITAIPAAGTTGTIAVTTAAGTGTSAATFTVNPSPTISASVTPASGLICTVAGNVSLNSVGTGAGYSWLPTTGLSNPAIANPIASPTVTTTYTVSTTSGGCTATATKTVVYAPLVATITQSPVGLLCGVTPTLSVVATGGGGAAPPAAGARYYVRDLDPWGSASYADGMNAVFGVGNWSPITYASATPATIFVPSTQFVYLEGSNGNETSQTSYLTANLPAIEAWVNAGGRLLINRGPNTGALTTNFGFGGVTNNWSNPQGTVNVAPTHPIVSGPFTPAGAGPYTGGSYSHATISGGSTTPIISGGGFDVLTEKVWGNGLVLFGGYTAPSFHSPAPNAQNLYQNWVSYCANAALGVPYGYSWAPGAAITSSITAPTSGTYTVTVTPPAGCPAGSATATVTINPAVTITASGLPTNVCPGGSSTLTASGADTYTWMPGSLSGATVTVSPLTATTYTVTGTSTLTGCTSTAVVAITTSPAPVFSAASATPAILCPNDVTTLTASATETIGAPGPGAYTLTSIPFAPALPTGPTTPGPTGDDATLAITLPWPFTFYGNTYTTIYPSTNGFISFDPAAGAGCCSGQILPSATSPNNMIDLVHTDMNVTGGANNIDCYALTSPNRFVIRYNNVSQYSAGPGVFTSQAILYQDGTIEIHNTSVAGFTSFSMTQGIENSTGTLATPVTGRNGTSSWSATNDAYRFAQFVSNPISNYTWSDPIAGVIASPTSQTTTANPTAAYTYTVTATSGNGCTASSTVSVTMKPTITGTANATPAAICLGGTSTLDGNIPLVCGGTETTFAGTYAPVNWTISNINSNGLINTAGAPANIILTSGTNASGVEGYTVYRKKIDCAGTVSFNWAYTTPDIAFLDQPQFRVNSGAWAVMTGFSNVGAASQSGTQTITVAAGDTINLAAYTFDNDGIACTVTLSNFSAPAAPIAGFVNFWDAPTGGTLVGAAPTPVSPIATTPYYAQYNTTTLAGCTNPIRDLVTVTVNAAPTVTATATPAAICLGSSSVLSGGGATSYTWDGANPNPYTVTPVATTSYTVTGTDGNGCTNTTSISVTVNPAPVMTSLTATPSTICSNGSSTLSVAPGIAGAAVYCIPTISFAGASGDFISNFNFNTGAINNSTGDAASDYTDYSATLSANVTAGSLYPVAITSDPAYGEGKGLFIDFNQDGDFDDAGELVFASPSGIGVASGTITIPATATNGTTRMRAAATYASVVTSSQACSGFSFGEYEDYGLVITGGVPAAAGFASIAWSPATYLNATNVATVTASAVMANTTYTVTGTDANGCSVTSSIALTVTPAPTGNTQATAIAATLPYTGTGDNLASNCWTSEYVGLNASLSPDVFYQFTMPNCNDSIMVSLCAATSFDTYLHLLDNTGTQIAFNDDNCGVQSSINLGGLTPGATYYVVVEGYSSNTGTYSLDMTSYQGAGLLTVTATATPNGTTCENTSVTLTGNGATTYTWMPASVVDGQAFAAMSGTNTYTVTGTNGVGCSATATISVTGTTASSDLANAGAGNMSSTTGTSNQSQTQPDGSNLSYYDATCHLIAGVDDGAGGNVLGATVATVTVEATVPNYNGQPYARRWYEITPTNNGPANITLYLTQADFNDYNAVVALPYLPLPTGPLDVVGIANVRVTKVNGALGSGTPIVITPTMTWDAANMRWAVTFAVPSFSQFFIHSVNPGNVPLPATITNFSGRKMSNSDMLTWTTASEQNNAHFNLQYATDGINFKTIAKVNSQAANGNSNTTLNYSYEHMNPTLGHNYYRLEQVDIDNHTTLNQQVVDLIWGSNGSTVSIYPNPTKDVLNIDLYTSKVQNTTVKVLDMSGRIIKQIQARSEVGMNQLSISLGDIASGVYTVQIYENDQLTQVSKVKKN